MRRRTDRRRTRPTGSTRRRGRRCTGHRSSRAHRAWARSTDRCGPPEGAAHELARSAMSPQALIRADGRVPGGPGRRECRDGCWRRGCGPPDDPARRQDDRGRQETQGKSSSMPSPDRSRPTRCRSGRACPSGAGHRHRHPCLRHRRTGHPDSRRPGWCRHGRGRGRVEGAGARLAADELAVRILRQ